MTQTSQCALIDSAIDIVGLQPLADSCGVTYQAIRKWQRHGMPRTEFTGETGYAKSIEAATKRKVKASALLKAQPQRAPRAA